MGTIFLQKDASLKECKTHSRADSRTVDCIDYYVFIFVFEIEILMLENKVRQ